MDDAKRRRLEESGFKVDTLRRALDLSDEDMEVIELRLENKRLREALDWHATHCDEPSHAVRALDLSAGDDGK